MSALRAVENADGSFRYEAVEGRLDGADRERLARLVFDRDRPTPTLADGDDLLAALQRQALEDQYQDLLRHIGRSGSTADLPKLLDRKLRLERELGLAQ